MIDLEIPNIIGWFLLFVVFSGLFITTAISYGSLGEAALIWGASMLLTSLVVTGVFLICR